MYHFHFHLNCSEDASFSGDKQRCYIIYWVPPTEKYEFAAAFPPAQWFETSWSIWSQTTHDSFVTENMPCIVYLFDASEEVAFTSVWTQIALLQLS